MFIEPLNPKANARAGRPEQDVTDAQSRAAGLADEDSRVARSPVDVTVIPGWGVDADDRNDPTWPMRDRAFDDSPGRHWQSPPAQPQDVELLMSIEHNQRPAVFGSANPPAGLSGVLRRVAFKSSESRWTHWLLLMAADRINVVEGVIDDVGHGRFPNLWKELGLGAAWKHDRKAFIGRTTAAVAVTGAAFAAVYFFSRRRAR